MRFRINHDPDADAFACVEGPALGVAEGAQDAFDDREQRVRGHGRVEPDDRHGDISTLKAVELRPANEAGDAVLSYVFEGRVLNPKAGDVGCFDGAATLSLRSQASGGLAMAGPTWTNRAWSRGLNTAGVLRLTRIRADFWTPLTFGLIKR